MKRSRTDAADFGRRIEALVVELLQSDGKFVLPAGALGPEGLKGRAPLLAGQDEAVISPDLIVAARGKTGFVEVKGKAGATQRRTTGYFETGFADRHLKAYLAFQEHTGMRGDVVFVHVDQGEVLVAPVDRFKLARVAKDEGTLKAFGEPMVFARCLDLDLWMTFDDIDRRLPFGTKTLTAEREVRYAELADDVFGVNPEQPRDIADHKMLEWIERVGASLMPSGWVSCKPGQNTYRFRRAFHYWIRISDAGKEWAAGQLARHAIVDRVAVPERLWELQQRAPTRATILADTFELPASERREAAE